MEAAIRWKKGKKNGPFSEETARVFHNRTDRLVAQADGPHDSLDIHQRHRVSRILKIRIHIVRCSTGSALDVGKVHEGFIKFQDRYRNQRKYPAIVIAG